MPKLKGTIVSVEMKETVVVAVPRTMRHPKYGKVIKRTTRLSAHNEFDGLVAGDVVELVESRPYSKTVFFKVISKVSGPMKTQKQSEITKLDEELKIEKEVSKTKKIAKK